jgi:sec-independent protein translocase protein TatA
MELVVVMIIALVVLGPKKLPEVGKSVGKGLREFKSAISGGDDGSAGERLLAEVEATHKPAATATDPS